MALALALAFACSGGCATASNPETPGLSATSAARVCATLVACGVPLPFAACASAAQNLASNGPDAVSAAVLRCASEATSCAALARCVGGGHEPDFCRANPNGACDGNVLVTCRGTQVPFAIDCGRWSHGTCGMLGDRIACLNIPQCVLNMRPRCEGNVVITCAGTRAFDGVRFQAIDCERAWPGSRCMEVGAERTPSCVPTSRPTCPAIATRCEGSTAVLCVAGRSDDAGFFWAFDQPRELRVDCGAMDQACRVQPETGQAACVRPADECIEGATMCTGATTMQACVAGRLREVDCAAAGFARCASGVCRAM